MRLILWEASCGDGIDGAELMRTPRRLLKNVGLGIVAASLLLPLLLYAERTAGTGKVDTVTWALCTLFFWLGLILWVANRSK